MQEIGARLVAAANFRQKHDELGRTPQHLVAVEKAILALNNFMGFGRDGRSNILQPNDLRCIFAAVFRSGEVHRVFVETFASRLGGADGARAVAGIGFAGAFGGTAQRVAVNTVAGRIADKISEGVGNPVHIKYKRRAMEPQPEPIIFNPK